MTMRETVAAGEHLAGLRVPMRDGRTLLTDAVLPDGEGPWPASLVRTPYGRWQEIEHARALARDGVAMVIQDVAGRFGSDGRFAFLGTEGSDGADTIGWIAAQPWCDGRVAMRGFSYRGFVQWHAALERPPALRAIAPLMSPWWWKPPAFRVAGGPVQLAAVTHWLPRQAAEAPGVPEELREKWFGRSYEPEEIFDGAFLSMEKLLAHPGLARWPLDDPWPVEGSAEFEPMWRGMFRLPPSRTPFDRDAPAADRVDVPALVVAGWYDPSCADAFSAFDHIRRTSPPDVARAHRMIVLPMGHGDPLAEVDPGPEMWRFGIDPDHRWALEWLHDDARALRDLAPFTYFVLGPNRWESSDAWPPSGSVARALFLDAGRARLVDRPPDESEAVFDYDPRRPVPTRGGAALKLPAGPCDQSGITAGARDDVLSFDGEPLDQPMTLAGPVVAELFASSSARDTDFTAKLIDVAPDGRARSISDGIVRARYRNGSVEQFLGPGMVERFAIHLGHVAYELPAGHALRLDVSSSNFPLYDRNANTGAPEGTDRAEDLVVAQQRVQAGGSFASKVTVTVMP